MEVPSTDWRSQLQPDARQRIVNKIMDNLKLHFPAPHSEAMSDLKKISIRFEEKIYNAAVNQTDYLRKISLKLLSIETKTQQNNSQPGANQNFMDTGMLGGSQVNNQGHPLVQIPMVSLPPGRQQLLAQNLQNNSPASMQGSSSISSSGHNQSTLTNYSHTPNMQNISGISHTSVNNSLALGATDTYGSAQRQLQGRQQQQSFLPQQQQHLQNPLLYQNQLQPELFKQKLHNNAHMPSMQQQQPQQPLLQANQLQSSQLSMVQLSSGLSSGQSSIQQSQATTIYSASQSSLQQNQLNSIQQSATSLLPQHVQAIARQSQQPLTSICPQISLQQSAGIQQQSNLQTEQQLLGQQPTTSNIKQSQLIGQQNNIVDVEQQQQQRLPVQQNNLVNMQQSQQLVNHQTVSLHLQQLGQQTNMQGLQQQQQPQSQQPPQQQLLGSLQNISNMQTYQRSMQLLQPSKNMSQTQQQVQQPSMVLLQSQGQQSHILSSQQQLMPQFQSQPGKLQQSLAMQQKSNSIPREMQQRLQISGALLQSQTAMEQKKPFMQSQRRIPEVSSSTSIDSTAQTGQNGGDWQEEAYQKIQGMRDAYFGELRDLFLKISHKSQQSDMTHPNQSQGSEKLKNLQVFLDRAVTVLQISKNNITPILKERLPYFEKQIVHLLSSNRRQKLSSSQQQGQHQFQNSKGHAQSTSQHQPSQVLQTQQQENQGNQVQQMNMPGPPTTMQSAAASSMQHGGIPLSVPSAQQNVSNSAQSDSDLDPVQVNSFGSLQQGSMGSMRQNGLGGSLQNSVSTTQQTNLNTISQSPISALQTNSSSLQHLNVLQPQHLKQQQEEHLMQNQQLKQQLQQHQIQQQLLQQHLHQQQEQQPSSQMPVHQISQLHPVSELNELKAKQGFGIKAGLYQQPYTGGQRHNYQLKAPSFSISSPQNLQASSPQISHHSSPQIDQHALLPTITKGGTPIQTSSSTFVVPSPSTLAPSPKPGDSEKLVSAAVSHQTTGQTSHQQAASMPPQSQAISVATPGISASPLLAEFTCQEGNMPHASAILRTNSSERPLENLIKAVQSLSPEALRSAVSDITSIVSMIDRIAGSAPGNGSRAAVGEDLVAMTKCRLQARSFMSLDGGAIVKKMKRHRSAMPLNNISSTGSVNENFMKFNCLDSSEAEYTTTSRAKKRKLEGNHDLQEEIREINRQLIDIVVSICDEDSDSVAAASEDGEGIIVKCSFGAVALSPSLKAHFASMHMPPISPLRLFIPSSYPNSSPLLLDKLPLEPSKELEDLNIKANSRFGVSLRCLSQPMSLGEMAGMWHNCARQAILEYAQRTGGGSFSSTYGSWENCVGA